jgi:hypothetical protein
MVEWLIPLLLVPVIVIPLVLLLGFAGCGLETTGTPWSSVKPIITSAVGTSSGTIALTWTFAAEADHFQLERRFEHEEPVDPLVDPVFSPHEDAGPQDGLVPAGTYRYRVRAFFQGTSSAWSDLATATTFAMAFDQSIPEDGGGFNHNLGYCLVQLIKAARLNNIPATGGKPVRITLRAANGNLGGVSIVRMTISQPVPPGQGNPYDSLAAPTSVPFDGPPPLVVPAGSAHLTVDYTLLEDEDLLIAFDFSPDTNASFGFADVPPEDAVAYGHEGHEALEVARSPDYQVFDQVILVEKIEVGGVPPIP